MKRFAPTLLIAAAVGFGTTACSDEAAHEAAQTSSPVAGVPVDVVDLPDVLPVQGTTRARQRAEMSTRLMARVTRVPVEIGQRVGRGELLIQLGTDDIAANRAKATAAVNVAQAAFDEAARQADRMDRLHEQDVVALVDRDRARLARTHAESQLAMAQAGLDGVAAADRYSRIVAPFPGVVVARQVDPGDLAAPGAPLLAIESEGARDAVLSIPAESDPVPSPGTEIEVTTSAGDRVTGVVRAVSGGADARTRTIEVLVELPADWPTGIAVTGHVPMGTRQAVLVPVGAIVRRGQLTGVQIATDNGALLRWVRLGRTVGEQVEVLSGLDANDRIIP